MPLVATRRIEAWTLNLQMEARMAAGVPENLALGAVFSDAYTWKVMDQIYSCQDFSHRSYTHSFTQLRRTQKARGAGNERHYCIARMMARAPR